MRDDTGLDIPEMRVDGGASASESVTNSLFDDMFKSAPTGTAADEPASPTPSSGSEGPSAGPRVFRRQR